MARIKPIAVELQQGFGIALPASVHVDVGDVADLVGVDAEVSDAGVGVAGAVEDRWDAVRGVGVSFDDGSRVVSDRRDVVVVVLQIVVICVGAARGCLLYTSPSPRDS